LCILAQTSDPWLGCKCKKLS